MVVAELVDTDISPLESAIVVEEAFSDSGNGNGERKDELPLGEEIDVTALYFRDCAGHEIPSADEQLGLISEYLNDQNVTGRPLSLLSPVLAGYPKAL